MKNNFLKCVLALVVGIAATFSCLGFVGCKNCNHTEVSSLTLNKTSVTLAQFASETLVVTVNPSNATVTWGSLDESRVTVDSHGTIRALKLTTSPVIITAIAGNKIAICAVTVVPSELGYEQEPTVAFSADSLEAGRYTSLTTLQENIAWVTASTASDGYIDVDGNSKTVDGVKYTQRIKLCGLGTANSRSIKLVLDRGAKIVLHCVSSSKSEQRTVNLYDDSFTAVTGQTFNLAPTSDPTVETLVVTAPGTYYIGTQTGGLNIYGLYIYYQI